MPRPQSSTIVDNHMAHIQQAAEDASRPSSSPICLIRFVSAIRSLRIISRGSAKNRLLVSSIEVARTRNGVHLSHHRDEAEACLSDNIGLLRANMPLGADFLQNRTDGLVVENVIAIGISFFARLYQNPRVLNHLPNLFKKLS